MRAQYVYQGLLPREWTEAERRAVGLIRGGKTLLDAAEEAGANSERVEAAWAIHAATPEGKAHLAANARVKILGAKEKAQVEAELKGRDGALALREQLSVEIEQLKATLKQTKVDLDVAQSGREAAAESAINLAAAGDRARAEVEQLHLDLRGLQKDYDGLRASLESEAERARALEVERDAAREEVGQLRAALVDVSSLREVEQRAALNAAEAQRRAEAHSRGAALEALRLAAQVRGIEELVVAVRGLAGAYPSSCESCGSPTSRTRALVEQRDRYKKQATEAKALLDSYQADWEELAARRAGTWRADR